MFPSREKFRFSPEPGDRQLWAIGLVAVEWSAVEMLLKAYAHSLTEDDPQARARYDETLVTRHRLRQLREIVDARVVEPFRRDLNALLDRVSQMQQERDRIVHGGWGVEEPRSDAPLRAFDYGKPRKPFDWKLTFSDIRNVALKIDAIAHELVAFCMRLEPRSQTEMVLVSTALTRILKQPNPDPSPSVPPLGDPATQREP